MDDDDLILAAVAIIGAAAAVVVEEEEEQEQAILDKRKGRTWESALTRSRKTEGAFYTTVPNLALDQEVTDLPCNRKGTFRNFVRMTKDEYIHLLELVQPHIEKQDTHYREAIPSAERLMVTLRYLATGSSMTQLSYNWRISAASLSHIIAETCEAIILVLKPLYLKTPVSVAEWQDIAKEMETHWNFPNAIGALDGKHIMMNKPWRAGSQYHNYKGTESIVLMAMCDHNYRFTYVDVGCQGRISDGGVFRNSSLSQAMESNAINLPPPSSPVGWHGDSLPYVILADEAFPLKENMMRPYARRQLTAERRIFNYRLSRGRRLIENAFGILAATWRILLRRIDLQPDKVSNLTMACCALHNYLRTNRPPPQGAAPTAAAADCGDDRLNDIADVPLRPTAAASAVRDSFCQYLNNIGSVPWQRRMAIAEIEDM